MDLPSRLDRWENRSEWPLAAIAVVFLAAYSVQVIAQPPGLTSDVLEGTLYALWAIFAIDYIARLWLADQRMRWFVRHGLELATVVVPFLRPLGPTPASQTRRGRRLLGR
jgi:voltage-gated potassium channel